MGKNMMNDWVHYVQTRPYFTTLKLLQKSQIRFKIVMIIDFFPSFLGCYNNRYIISTIEVDMKSNTLCYAVLYWLLSIWIKFPIVKNRYHHTMAPWRQHAVPAAEALLAVSWVRSKVPAVFAAASVGDGNIGGFTYLVYLGWFYVM